jgi:hypothetical protein
MVELLLLRGGRQNPADAHHRKGADLDVEVGRAVVDGNLQEIVDVHGPVAILAPLAAVRGTV